jgi:hypothetical protein
MPKFIQVKLIEVEEMDFKTFIASMGQSEEIFMAGRVNEPGYLIGDKSTGVGWVSEIDFLKDHFRLVEGNKIWPEDIDAFIDSEITGRIGENTSVMQYRLINGYEVTATAACVQKDSHDPCKANEIMRANLNAKVKELLSFLLRCARNGFN